MTKQPTAEQIEALRAFAAKHGRTWKSKLIDAWTGWGNIQDGPILRGVRNEFGPTWLIDKFRLPSAS